MQCDIFMPRPPQCSQGLTHTPASVMCSWQCRSPMVFTLSLACTSASHLPNNNIYTHAHIEKHTMAQNLRTLEPERITWLKSWHRRRMAKKTAAFWVGSRSRKRKEALKKMRWTPGWPKYVLSRTYYRCILYLSSEDYSHEHVSWIRPKCLSPNPSEVGTQ